MKSFDMTQKSVNMKSKRRRCTDPDVRRTEILKAAVELSQITGYVAITRDRVAERANVSTGLVTNYFDTMENLKSAVMEYAVKHDILPIIAQGLTLNDPIVMKNRERLKRKVRSYFS